MAKEVSKAQLERLTEQDKEKIYDLWMDHKDEGVTQESLAQRFGCSRNQISAIISYIRKKRANDIPTSN